jgi:hypothetical protein
MLQMLAVFSVLGTIVRLVTNYMLTLIAIYTVSSWDINLIVIGTIKFKEFLYLLLRQVKLLLEGFQIMCLRKEVKVKF